MTLPCFHSSTIKYLCWYKQVAGERPEVISSFYKRASDSSKFYNHFKDDKRFSIHPGENFYHLNISNVQHLDSAMYFCGEFKTTHIEFLSGIFLIFKGILPVVLHFGLFPFTINPV